jgi:hypothetical protein
VRERRLEIARRNKLWTEIENDLVARPPRFLVSASTDAVYRRDTGTVFQPGSAGIVDEHRHLSFYVDDAGDIVFLDPQPHTWSEIVARTVRRA